MRLWCRPSSEWWKSWRPSSGLAVSSEFEARAFASANDTVLQNYPFRWMMWIPLLARDKRPLGGVLLARETAWTKPDRVIGERLARIVAYAWAALDSEGRATPRMKVNRWMAAISRSGAGAAVARAGPE